MFKQAQTEFFRQRTRDNFVNLFRRDQTTLDRLRQMACAVIFRQLDVQPGIKRQRRRFRRILRNAMMLVQQADAAVIGNHNAVKAPAFTQYCGQQETIAMTRLIVDVVIRRHHRASIG